MVEITHANNEKNGVFEIYFNEKKAGRMTYVWAGNEKFIIDHTEIDELFSGKGLGKELVKAAVEFARKNNFKIVPLCPFAKKVIDKTREFQDVMS